MTIFGIGPLLAFVGGMGLILIFVLQRWLGIEMACPAHWRPVLSVIGAILGAIGIYFWAASLLLVGRGFHSHQLVTRGVYRCCRHPLYSAIIVFLVPALAFSLNNFLVLLISVVMLVVFKMRIRREEDYLAREFGEEYRRYAERVPQLIPFIHI